MISPMILKTSAAAVCYWVLLVCQLATTASLACAPVPDDQLAQLQLQFERQIAPMLESKCGQCHIGQDANAGINVEAFKDLEQVLNADRKWRLIASEIESGTMPPEDEPQLSAPSEGSVLNRGSTACLI